MAKDKLVELEDRMTFSAHDRCQCGAGFAYDPKGGPDKGTPFVMPSLWHCSDTVLYPLETPERRAAIIAAMHDRPVDMSIGVIRGERDDRGTTRSEASQQRRAAALRSHAHTVGLDTVRKVVLQWLTEEHGATFTDDTTLRFCAGDSIAVTTRFDQVPPPAQPLEPKD